MCQYRLRSYKILTAYDFFFNLGGGGGGCGYLTCVECYILPQIHLLLSYMC